MSPREVEGVLLQLEGVASANVYGVPDAKRGNVVGAVVVPKPGAALDGDSIRKQSAKFLSAYKVPRVVEFSDALPREESGKIFKRRLRDPYWKDAGRRI